MALPPSVFTTVAKGLKKNNYSPKGINRIIIEKPFGKDLESCREMMKALKQEWSEDETFRIDHYLGKEMVKNLLVMRFGNVFFDSSFNKNSISNVQITFKEDIGTEGRGGYFDEVRNYSIVANLYVSNSVLFGDGSICSSESFETFSRTVSDLYACYLPIQFLISQHPSRSFIADLLQALSVLTMERPVSFSAEDIRDEKVSIWNCFGLDMLPLVLTITTSFCQSKGQGSPGRSSYQEGGYPTWSVRCGQRQAWIP